MVWDSKMNELLTKFEKKEPELIVNWNDNETDAKGWLVINSLRGGAAGGGTRMKKGIDGREVLLLAKTMEIKFTVSGPPIGGAKSGIDFDPLDPRKREVLGRWYKAILPLLKNYYGTGGDLNVDYIDDVIPITKELGILHPQEGILNGHLKGNSKEKKTVNLSKGTSKIVQDHRFTPDTKGNYTVADLISGYSVAESVIHYYRIFQGDLKRKRAIIQGWGNVGSSAGYFLSQSGVKIIGILDIEGGIINEMGFDFSDIRDFMLNRKTDKFSGHQLIPNDEIMKTIWKIPADIFVPAAASKLITRSQVQSMINGGIELIACGANVPFADDENFFGEVSEFADNRISVIPDFIANSGMARVFAYLMQSDAVISDESIFEDVSKTIKAALVKVCNGGSKSTQLAQTFYDNALNQLV